MISQHKMPSCTIISRISAHRPLDSNRIHHLPTKRLLPATKSARTINCAKSFDTFDARKILGTSSWSSTNRNWLVCDSNSSLPLEHWKKLVLRSPRYAFLESLSLFTHTIVILVTIQDWRGRSYICSTCRASRAHSHRQTSS